MKLHKSVTRNDRFGGITTTTLCGRMNKACDDRMNIADDDVGVTCRFCLQSIQISRRLRAAKARRESAVA